MASKKQVDKKTIYDIVEKYKWGLGIAAYVVLGGFDKYTEIKTQLTELKKTDIEFKIKLENVIEEVHRN